MSKRHKPISDELSNEEHLELLNNKEADEFSRYLTFLEMEELFGEEYALKSLGLTIPPENPEK